MENNNYSEDYVVEEKKFKITRGLVLLAGIILVILIISIIVIINIVKSLEPKYEKSDFEYLESRMKEASTTYMVQNNRKLTPNAIIIKLDDLLIKNGGEINPSKVKAAKICDGYVEAKLEDQEIYKSYIKCIYKNKEVYKTKGYKVSIPEKTTTTKDTEKPVITLKGNAEITINIGEEFIDEGVTAVDNEDGDITSKIKKTGNVDTKKQGNYTITYIVSDKAGNRAEAIRKVEVIKPTTTEVKTEPVIVTTTTTKKKTTRQGSSGGTIKTTTRNTIPPTIVLKGANYITLNIGAIYSEPGYSARDSKGNDLTGNVRVSGSVNTGIAGTYVVKYSVTDSSGLTSTKQRTVKVISNYISLKSIKLTPNSVSLSVGKTIKVSVTYDPTNATNKTVSWSSANTRIATVSNGTIKGISRGSTTITVKGADNVSTRLTVVVK